MGNVGSSGWGSAKLGLNKTKAQQKRDFDNLWKKLRSQDFRPADCTESKKKRRALSDAQNPPCLSENFIHLSAFKAFLFELHQEYRSRRDLTDDEKGHTECFADRIISLHQIESDGLRKACFYHIFCELVELYGFQLSSQLKDPFAFDPDEEMTVPCCKKIALAGSNRSHNTRRRVDSLSADNPPAPSDDSSTKDVDGDIQGQSPLLDLPLELLHKIFSMMHARELCALSCVCRLFKVIADEYKGSSELYGWGWNKVKQCVADAEDIIVQPQLVTEVMGLLGGDEIAGLSAGESHSAIVTTRGQVYTWGENKDGRCGRVPQPEKDVYSLPAAVSFSEPIAMVSAGGSHTLALSTSGNLYSFGYNFFGQLGAGGPTSTVRTPQLVHHFTQNKIRPVYILASKDHSLALTDHGQVYAWGNNKFGQLGLGTRADRATPTLVEALLGHKVSLISSGSKHTVVVTEQDLLFAWGENDYGQFGCGDQQAQSLPRFVPYFSKLNALQVCVCGYRTMLVTEGGLVYASGRNDYGQLGIDDRMDRAFPTPVISLLFPDTRIIQVAAGTDHAVALTNTLQLYSFGWNGGGQLGIGNRTHTMVPALVCGPNDKKLSFLKVACGHNHVLATAFLEV